MLAPTCPRCHDRHLPDLVCWTGRYTYRVRALVLETYGDRCVHCGLAGSRSVEHLVPRSRGGDDSLANTRPAHLRCNQERGVHAMNTPAPTHSPRVSAMLGPSR